MLSADKQWVRLLHAIMDFGAPVFPRGLETKELLGYQTQIDMSRPIVTHPERKLGYKFQAAEAAWILSGDNRVETIKPFSREIEKFSDNGVTFFGAYGPKILDQVGYITDCLANDPESRQAVINIWRECPPATKDVPCTLSAQFVLRDGRINCIDTMRSSDAWLGWPYDVFNFSMLSAMIAMRLWHKYQIKVELGVLILTAGSQHLYAKNFDAVKRVIGKLPTYVEYPPLVNFHGNTADHFLTALWEVAKGQGALDFAQRGWR